MKRIIATLLCMLSVVILFTACGKDETTRVKELDGTVWPLTGQTFSDGTGFTSEDLNSYGLYGCLSFSGGKFTLLLDTSPLTGDYNVDGDSVELVDLYTLTKDGDELILSMDGASMTFTYDSALIPADEMKLSGTSWSLTYLKNDNGVFSASQLKELNYKGTISFNDSAFVMTSDVDGNVTSQTGTYEATKAIITLSVGEEYVYAFINGANLIIAESGISMVYTINN